MSNKLLSKEQQDRIIEEVNKLLPPNIENFNAWDNLLAILTKEDIELREADLKEISGILSRREDDKWTLYVNREDSRTRKLFTIAHELGHYFLHRSQGDKFIDGQLTQVVWKRYEEERMEVQEIEANEFAGNLIMPESVIKNEIERMEIKDFDGDEVADLATKFNVSPIAMFTRLKNLNYAK